MQALTRVRITFAALGGVDAIQGGHGGYSSARSIGQQNQSTVGAIHEMPRRMRRANTTKLQGAGPSPCPHILSERTKRPWRVH